MSKASSTDTTFSGVTSGNDSVEVLAGYRDGVPVIVISSGVFGAILSLRDAATLVAAITEMMAHILSEEEPEDMASYS